MYKNEEKVEISDLKKVLFWIVDKKMYFFSLFACVLFINVIIYKVKPLISNKTPEGAILANQTYSDWKDASFKDSEKLDKLKSLVKKYPNLQPKYEGLIIQNLLMNDKLSKDDNSLADKALERIKSDLPFYYEYSKNAILINNGEFQEALNKSKELKTKMLGNFSLLEAKGLEAYCILFSFNLLRIALLEEKLSNVNNELLAWQELEDYLNIGSNKSNVQIQTVSKTFKDIFNENGIELTDFIQYRKAQISPIK